MGSMRTAHVLIACAVGTCSSLSAYIVPSMRRLHVQLADGSWQSEFSFFSSFFSSFLLPLFPSLSSLPSTFTSNSSYNSTRTQPWNMQYDLHPTGCDCPAQDGYGPGSSGHPPPQKPQGTKTQSRDMPILDSGTRGKLTEVSQCGHVTAPTPAGRAPAKYVLHDYRIYIANSRQS